MYDCNKGCGRMVTARGKVCYYCRKQRPLGKNPFQQVKRMTLRHDGILRDHEFSTHFKFGYREVCLPKSRYSKEEGQENVITVPLWIFRDRKISAEFEIRREGA